MPELLKGVDSWFLILTALAFLYMVNRSFGKFDETLKRFETLFDKVFEKHETLDARLSRLEGKCAATDHGFATARQGTGRRTTDQEVDQ